MRRSTPISRTDASTARAHLMAAVGEFNDAKKPSPAVSIYSASEPAQLSAYSGVVHLEEIGPRLIAERSSSLRGADDVGEHDRGHDSDRFGSPVGR